MITIDELMTVNPYSLGAGNSLEDARKLMTEKNIRHIPITDAEQHLVGLVTQRDILEASNPGAEAASDGVSLSDIMIKDVSVITQTSSVREAGLFLQKHKYGCLPVVDNNRLVGIITDSDFITVAINLIEQVEIAEDTDDFDTVDDSLDDFDIPALEDDY